MLIFKQRRGQKRLLLVRIGLNNGQIGASSSNSLQTSQSVTVSNVLKICIKCRGEVGKGLTHNCSDASFSKNIVSQVLQLADMQQGQVITNSKNIIGDKTMLMSFQNGIGHEEIMQNIAGKDKVLGGSTTQASSIQGPGIIQNHASLPSWIGEYDGGHSQRVKDLAETFTSHGLETIAEEDIKRRKWMKLFALTAIGPLSAIFDLHHTDLYISNKNQNMSRNLGKEIILETREVAKADGVDVSEKDCLEMFNRIVDSRQTNKSSMAFDVLKNRKTEIDFISGAVSKIGKKHGVKTPLNDLMYNIIKIKEGMYI